MLYISTICLVVFNFFYNLKSNKSKLLLSINFIFLVILLGFTYGPYDTQIFIERYIYYQKFENFTEGLFNIIVKFFNSIGMSYRLFMVSLSLVELFFIFKFIKKYTSNPFFVIALFMIYPMIVWFTQLRFLMAFTIVLTGGINALIEKKKSYKLKATIFILLASLIHSSSLFYLIFVFADSFSNKKTFFLSILIMTCSLFIEPLMKLATMIIGTTKINAIIAEMGRTTGVFGRCATASTMIGGYFFIYYLIKSDKKYCESNKKEILFIDTIFKYNSWAMICVPLIITFSTAFYRIPQSLLLLNYIAISKYIASNRDFKIRKNEFIIYIITILYSIILFFMMFHTEEIYKLVVIPFFEQNVIARIFNI